LQKNRNRINQGDEKMNTIQKIFLIVGFIPFGFWFLSPILQQELNSILRSPTGWGWFEYWYQLLSFVIALGCFFGFCLFKDKEKIE
tara:strand:- start:74 stop:331 length:258 start_codon:yes stop_codon:yes gene_type:complete